MRESPTSRIVWLDAVRGAGMGLVVLGHMAVPATLNCLIYAFHMPLFFIVTGYLYRSSRPAGEIVRGKAKGLLVPYYAFSALMILLLTRFPDPWVSEILSGRSWTDLVWPTVLGTTPVIEPTWFLPCLFATSVAALPLRSLTDWKPVLMALAALLVLAQVWSSRHWPGLPFRLHNVPFGLIFLLTGMLWQKHVKWAWMSSRQGVMAAGLAAAIFVPLALVHGRVDLNSNLLGCAALYWATGTLGTAAVFFICRSVESMKPVLLAPLAYLGRRSLYILVTHQAVAAIVHIQFGEWGLTHFRLDRVVSLIMLLAVVEAINGVSCVCQHVAKASRQMVMRDRDHS